MNIAARLQNYAEPGCIVPSETIIKLVLRELTVPVVDLGDLHLKNLSTPVRAYSLRVGTLKTPALFLNRIDNPRPSIAVLPFRRLCNWSGSLFCGRHRRRDYPCSYRSQGTLCDFARVNAGFGRPGRRPTIDW